jgi:integrase/recombinase XerD
MIAWRSSHTAGIHQLLRFVRSQWPTVPAPSTPEDTWRESLCGEFEQWLREWRGLAASSTAVLVDEARRFLSWCVSTRASVSLHDLQLSDVDGFLKDRCPPLRRVSRKNVTQSLRCFLRFLHAAERIQRDLAPGVISPTLYAFESIPSALRPEQIAAVLASVRQDRSSSGLRDHAVLLLLATYGLRAGEVARLRLEDVDWRGDRLWIRHTKTGARSCLPLIPAVGDALLDYLRQGRPATAAREVFIHMKAPYTAFARGSSLYPIVRKRLAAAGAEPDGKKGPHTFRHARAASLLRASVSTKAIGDLLGHRSAASTAPYLKLATEDLRAVALELPGQEARP